MDIRAGRRSRTDEQRSRAVAPSRRVVAQGQLWHAEEAGSRFVESMMTVVTTLRQQKRSVLAYLIAACEAALRGEAAPSLLPASDQISQAVA